MLVFVIQLKCIGGSAGCSAFVPQVIQCYNRGTDGSEVQVHCYHFTLFQKCRSFNDS